MSSIETILVMAQMWMATEDSRERNPYIYIEPKPEKAPEYRFTAGEGKNKYEFETEFGMVSIFAGNPKSAQKHLRTLEGYNRNVKSKRKYLKVE